MRRPLVCLLAVLGLLALGAPAASAAAPLRAQVLDTSQRAVLVRGGLMVRVRARRPVSVRVRALVRAGNRWWPLVTSRPARFQYPGRRTVRLPLTVRGRRLLQVCRRQRVRVLVRRKGTERSIARTGALLRVDSATCSGGGGSGGSGSAGGPGGGTGSVPGTENADRCDFLDPAVCLYPWPNDHFTRADPSTATGRRLNLNLLSMPRNVEGKPIDPTEFNRNDGFSPGNLIVTKVPGLDTPEAFARTGAVPITDMGRTFDPDQPVVVINARTGERHLIWSELDANPESPRDVTLIVRPAVNFEEGERYVVALRRLRNASGELIPPSRGFQVYRDRLITTQPEVERRRPHMESLFDTLARAGIARDDLYLAWDFTVGSQRSLSERMLHIRDDAFAQLGDTNLADMEVQGRSPDFVVTRVTNLSTGEDDRIARRIEGRIVVPCYLAAPACPPGSGFTYGSNGLPLRLPGNTMAANFVCNVPRAAVDGPTVVPGRPSLYGHGLLGTASQVSGGASRSLANEHNFVMCATDWIGMAQEDIPNVLTILNDLSRFHTLADRVQQGMLNFLYLGRAMIHPDGFSSDPAFQFARGGPLRSAIDTSRLYYVGGSQGGIIGGSLTAVAPDFDRASLGVPGMNYSTLLQRSIDFDEYGAAMYASYPAEIDRQLQFSLVQLLWDRAEANGYAHHMTSDPYPNTPPHEVLLNMAFGDHQVANVTTEVEARTIGAHVRVPGLDPGRSPDVTPHYGIPPIGAYPFAGSALTVWDIGPLRTEDGRVKGTPPPPTTNTPNREGVDPHGPDSSEEVTGRQQVSNFLRPGGQVIDVCGPRPCYLAGWTGPPSRRDRPQPSP